MFPSNCEWSATLLTPDVMATHPRVRFCIKRLRPNDTPTLKYNGRYYSLNAVGTDEYESDALQANEAVDTINIVVGNVSRSFHIHWKMGASEDDLFNF